MFEIETTARKFTYDKNHTENAVHTAGKDLHPLVRTDHLFSSVQVLREGGENNLHSHAHLDGFWFVLSGRVIFYGDQDVVIGDCSPGEGMLIPRGTKYWFEAAGDQELELLQVEASNISLNTIQDVVADRTNYTAPTNDNLETLTTPQM